jgi:DNA-binding transcriptional ArsR family regulator
MKSKDNALKLQTRRKIYEFIKNNPGLNFRELSRKTNIPKSTLEYHLNYLKKLDIIEIKSKGQFKFVYIKHKVGTHDKQILELLRQKIPCLIFLHFIYVTFFSKKELCEELELPSSTVDYNIKKLLDLGIIEEAQIENGRVFPYKGEKVKDVSYSRKPIGREIIYIRKNQEIIDDAYRLLITYKQSLPNKELIDTYIEFLDGLINLKDYLKKIGLKLPKKRLSDDEIYDLLQNFFKPPFAY